MFQDTCREKKNEMKLSYYEKVHDNQVTSVT